MKYLFTILFCIYFLCSSAQKVNFLELKQSVFGNLFIGVSEYDYNERFQAIAASTMSVAQRTKYPFFTLENKTFIDYRRSFLYPHAFTSKDSIVTKIVFYLYQVSFPSMDVVDSPDITSEQRKALGRIASENQNKLNFLMQDFDTKSSIDTQYSLFLPNIAQGNDFFYLERDMIANLHKYGLPSTITGGNEYDKYDFSFFKEQLWKTDKLNIRLVRKRYPIDRQDHSSEFYMVLIYELNEAIKKKFGIDNKHDLIQTF